MSDHRRRFLLTLPIDRFRQDHEYQQLPLHCTLVQYFLTEAHPREILERLRPVAKARKPIRLTALGPDMFGKKNDVPVYRIEKSKEIMGLHWAMLASLSLLDVTPEEPQWIGTGYQPHVSNTEDRSFVMGNQTEVGTIFLVRNLGGYKIPLEEVYLQG